MQEANFKDLDGNLYYIPVTRIKFGPKRFCDDRGKELLDKYGVPLIPIEKIQDGPIQVPAFNSSAANQYSMLNRQNAKRAEMSDKDIMTDSLRRKTFRREALTKGE